MKPQSSTTAYPVVQDTLNLAPHADRIIITGIERHLRRLLSRLERTFEATLLDHVVSNDERIVVGHSVVYHASQSSQNKTPDLGSPALLTGKLRGLLGGGEPSGIVT